MDVKVRVGLFGIGLDTYWPQFDGLLDYMWTSSEDNTPLADQWDVNVFMKDLLKENFYDF